MTRLRSIIVKALLLAFGLGLLVSSQVGCSDNAVILPPLNNQYLTPTLNDVLIYPGFTYR
jgi:hypothetical protein